MSEVTVSEPSIVPKEIEIHSGSSFVFGQEFGTTAVLIGRDPVGENSQDSDIKSGSLAVKLLDTSQSDTASRQLSLQRDEKGNFFIENLSASTPIKMQSELEGTRNLEPRQKILLGRKIQQLAGLKIGWGKRGALLHTLLVYRYSDIGTKWSVGFIYRASQT